MKQEEKPETIQYLIQYLVLYKCIFTVFLYSRGQLYSRKTARSKHSCVSTKTTIVT